MLKVVFLILKIKIYYLRKLEKLSALNSLFSITQKRPSSRSAFFYVLNNWLLLLVEPDVGIHIFSVINYLQYIHTCGQVAYFYRYRFAVVQYYIFLNRNKAA